MLILKDLLRANLKKCSYVLGNIVGMQVIKVRATVFITKKQREILAVLNVDINEYLRNI